VQDFLKAIYQLQREHERVTTSALASALGISAPAVTEMAQRLDDKGAVDYQKYRGVRLTAAGEAIALKVLRRHRLIEAFLVQDLGYQLHEVHDEAEALEHTVSDRFVEAVACKLGNPRFDPHGDPIPDRDGLMAQRDLLPLSKLPLQRLARIRRFIIDDPAMLQASQALGLVLEKQLLVLHREPFEGPLRIRLPQESTQTIGYKMASLILVELCQLAS